MTQSGAWYAYLSQRPSMCRGWDRDEGALSVPRGPLGFVEARARCTGCLDTKWQRAGGWGGGAGFNHRAVESLTCRGLILAILLMKDANGGSSLGGLSLLAQAHFSKSTARPPHRSSTASPFKTRAGVGASPACFACLIVRPVTVGRARSGSWKAIFKNPRRWQWLLPCASPLTASSGRCCRRRELGQSAVEDVMRTSFLEP